MYPPSSLTSASRRALSLARAHIHTHMHVKSVCVLVRQALTLALPLPIAFCLHYTVDTMCCLLILLQLVHPVHSNNNKNNNNGAAALLVVVGVAHTDTEEYYTLFFSLPLSVALSRVQCALSRSRLALQVTLCLLCVPCHALPCRSFTSEDSRL